jgi:hypothetical protein
MNLQIYFNYRCNSNYFFEDGVLNRSFKLFLQKSKSSGFYENLNF